MEDLIAKRIPKSLVLSTVEELLQDAGGKLEFENSTFTYTHDDLHKVISRAYVICDDEAGFGNHFEAGVGLGAVELSEGAWSYPKGILKIYFDLKGNMITEDRIPPHK